MRDLDTAKKSDWHPADIVAALRKAGWSLRRLSIAHDYHPDTLHRALRHPYPRAERLIARAIQLPAEQIWPERYARRRQQSNANSSARVVS